MLTYKYTNNYTYMTKYKNNITNIVFIFEYY